MKSSWFRRAGKLKITDISNAVASIICLAEKIAPAFRLRRRKECDGFDLVTGARS